MVKIETIEKQIDELQKELKNYDNIIRRKSRNGQKNQ